MGVEVESTPGVHVRVTIGVPEVRVQVDSGLSGTSVSQQCESKFSQVSRLKY